MLLRVFPVALLVAWTLVGCGKEATRTWEDVATVSGANASASPPVALKGWVRLRYTLKDKQDRPVRIFLSEAQKTKVLPRVLTLETNSTAQSGVVEQEVQAGEYGLFTSATGVWKITILTAK